MKIATWNVNSIRTRQQQVVDWLQQNPVEVLCLQETKTIDSLFPTAPFEQLGYHLSLSGQKAYNGVAILSRSPLEDTNIGFAPVLGEGVDADLDEQKRLIAGVIQGVCVVNVYVPNGGAIESEKYPYKLRWLKTLHQYLHKMLDRTENLCICGDFNIAPDERDIYKVTTPEDGIVGTTPPERALLQHITQLGLNDAFRMFTQEGGHYSWWDYRSGAFARNRGWLIDRLYITPSLSDRAIACTIDPSPRKWTQPSDHTPVVLELN